MIIGAFFGCRVFLGGGTSFGTHLISVPAMTKSSSASFAGLCFHSYSIFFSTVTLLPRNKRNSIEGFLSVKN